jgi:hypothetical protein
MLGKLFGPKYTLKDAMQILEKGLRNGEISVNAEAETGHTREAERMSFQPSPRVRIFAPMVSFGNVAWKGQLSVPEGQ